MLVRLKFRVIAALPFLLAMLCATGARAAAAPLRRGLAAPVPHSQAVPRQVPSRAARREIFLAIQRRLRQEGDAGRGNLRPQDLIIQTSVPGVDENAGMEVKRMRFDSLRGETVFELSTPRQPQYLPFAVATRRDPRLWETPRPGETPGQDGHGGGSVAGNGTHGVGPKPMVLAKPGSAATLVILGENMRITLTVVPLQPGVKGQDILVRDVATSRVMKAEVVSAGLLQAAL